MEELIPYLIVCPLVFLAGFIDAIAGGGGLISLPAYLIAGLPPHSAIATNKMSSTIGTSVALSHYIRCGFVNWRKVSAAIVTALIGSWIGSNLTLLIDAEALKIILLIILPLTAVYVLSGKSLSADRVEFAISKTILIIGVLSFFIGIYDGFYGPGTGTFLMLLLTAVAHISLNEAAGATKVINFTTNVMAFAVFLYEGVVDIRLGLLAAVFSILGNYMGARYFTSKGVSIARPVIIVVLSLFLIKVIYELFSK